MQLSLTQRQKEALKVKAERELGRRHLHNFARLVYPSFEVTRHHLYIGECLERAVRGEPGWNRIVFHAPPQHGKSLYCSKIFPSWYRGLFPDRHIISTSYGASHAHSFSRFVRNIVVTREFQLIFPGVMVAPDSKSVEHWELAYPFHGEYNANGIMGGITGKPGDLLIIDDPLKDREEAESEVIREKQIDAWKTTLSTRLHKDAIVIVIMTRWHEEDLAGYLLKNAVPAFKYVKLAGLAEENDPLERAVGEALWPDRFSRDMLLAQKLNLGTYDFAALYQGEPTDPEGALFKRSYFQVIPKAPEHLYWYRFWDLATSTRSSADYTASLMGAKDRDGNVYLKNMIRGRWEWPDVRKKIKATTLAEKCAMVGIEAVGTQKGMVQEIYQDEDLVSCGVLGITVTTDKRIRALPVASRGESGRLYLEDGPWVREYIDEMCSFDKGAHDDQVDATSGVFSMLNMTSGRVL